MQLTAVVKKEGEWYSSWCPDVDIASQGKTVDEALENLKEALELYFEDEDAITDSSPPLLTFIEIEAHA